MIFLPNMVFKKNTYQDTVHVMWTSAALANCFSALVCVHSAKRQNKQKLVMSRVRTSRVNVSDFYRVLRIADLNETTNVGVVFRTVTQK